MKLELLSCRKRAADEHVIAYVSKTSNEAQRDYSATQIELQDMLFAVENFTAI